MQLSSKASPVVLKPFTNVHSPFWHSSFQHLTHTLPKSPGTNTDATTTSNLVPLLTACCLVVVHHCPVCISPSPLCSRPEQQLCHPPFSTEAQPRCSAALPCQHPPSSLAECQGSVPALRAGSAGAGLAEAGSWEVPCWRGARAKEGVQASLYSAASDVKRSQVGRSI